MPLMFQLDYHYKKINVKNKAGYGDVQFCYSDTSWRLLLLPLARHCTAVIFALFFIFWHSRNF